MIARAYILVTLAFVAMTASAAPARLFKTAYDQNYLRYGSPYAIIQQFHKIVPYMDSGDSDYSNSAGSKCLNINSSSASVLGTNDPINGQNESEPGAVFWPFYRDCIMTLVHDAFQNADLASANLSTILGGDGLNDFVKHYFTLCPSDADHPDCVSTTQTDFMEGVWKTPWDKMPVELRHELYQDFLLYLAGPAVLLKDKKYFGDGNVFHADLPNEDALIAFLDAKILEQVRLAQAKSQTWTVAEAYAWLASLIWVGPESKS